MRPVLILTTALLVLAGLSGCNKPSDHACEKVSAPITDIAPATTDAVRLGVPVPQDWERNTKLDTALVRFAMANPKLAQDGFKPNAVVTAEVIPHGVGKSGEILDEQRKQLETQLGARDITPTPGSHCGYPSETITYTTPPRGRIPTRYSTVLCVVAEAAGNAYLITVTVGTVDPKNEAFQRDSDEIRKGFTVAPGH
jgi:hypothetical protein